MAKIAVILKGGFGNQLFQLLACYSLGKGANRDSFFYDLEINKDKYRRKNCVEEIAAILNIQKVQDIRDFIYFEESEIDHPIFYTRNSPFNKLGKKDILIEGYFQNYRRIDKESIILVRKFLQKNCKEYTGLNDKHIAIHLRELHGVGESEKKSNCDFINPIYYQRAINEILLENELTKHEFKLVVFMDLWKHRECSQLLPPLIQVAQKNKIKLILGDDICKTPLEIVSFMASAQYLIISNSTLSWFGGFLNSSKVYSPIMSLWEPQLYIPDSWKQLYDGNAYPSTHSGMRMKSNIIKQLDNYMEYNLIKKSIFKFKRFRKCRKIILKLKKLLGLIDE